MKDFCRRLIDDESGQDLIEYALLTTFVGLVAAATWNLTGAAIRTVYTSWDTSVNSVWRPSDPS